MTNKIRAVFLDFKKMKFYIAAAALIFVVGIFVGSQSTWFQAYLNSQVKALADVASELSELENSSFWIFLFIFLNNAVKSILIIFLGAFLGFLPVGFLLLNGMVLGYVYDLFMQEGGTLWQLVVGILPHGIIELPAVIIACAYGIRLGVLVLKKIIPWLVPMHRSQEGEMKSFMKRIFPLSGFLVVTLLIAAIIEATLTRWLITFF